MRDLLKKFSIGAFEVRYDLLLFRTVAKHRIKSADEILRKAISNSTWTKSLELLSYVICTHWLTKDLLTIVLGNKFCVNFGQVP